MGTSSTPAASSGGIGFFGALTLLFIALKLVDKIEWSWWWVLAPTWIPAVLVVAIIIVVVLRER